MNACGAFVIPGAGVENHFFIELVQTLDIVEVNIVCSTTYLKNS